MKATSKEQIQVSFRRLLFKKSLDKITVRDIVEDCGLTRNTFYYHYEDIYDLFDDYLDMQTREAWRSMPANSPWDQVLLTLICSIFDSPQTGRHIMSSKKSDTMRLYLNRLLEAMIERYIDRNMTGLQVAAEDRRMICDGVTHGIYGLLEQWISGPDASAMHSRLRRVIQSFEGGIRLSLEYCAAHPGKKEDLL
ncbi:MAG: TetR/AcrR family transcriptional regulator C-terminal domain-containing protein [Oscillospiraceae bacterium]|nr:TetR/AcrR family transcriptional regulator C-terminal domain-containing protein [Oscillospiraceae bacterium]